MTGFKHIHLCLDKQVISKSCKRFSFLIKMQAPKPENIGEECKILFFGLVIINDKGRIRAGFSRRCQIIAKC